VLVLDGYARADVLAEQYVFGNGAFLGALGERGFSIRGDAVANCSVTHTSLSSMMAGGYPFEEGPRSGASMDRIRRLLSGDGALLHAFDAAGYETVMFENAWAGSNYGGTPDVCHRTGLLGRSMWSLGQMTPLAVIQRVSVPHPFTAIGLQHLRELGGILEGDSAEPVFVMAHITVPHPPTQLTAACDFVVASDRLSMLLASADTAEADRATARRRCVDQMTCINGEVIATVDRLLASGEDLEMVIIADHRPNSHAQHAKDVADWTDDELLERRAVLSAARMPQTCAEREPARTTVNTVRRSVGCALGVQLDDLPDRNFGAPAAQAIDEPIVDVTDRMNSISSRISR
jgi:hypothetical protein